MLPSILLTAEALYLASTALIMASEYTSYSYTDIKNLLYFTPSLWHHNTHHILILTLKPYPVLTPFL